MAEQIQSVSELIERRHEKGQSIGAFVEGDLAHEPPLGNAAAMRLAHLLDDADEGVARVDPDNISDDYPDDPGVIVTELPENPPQQDWEAVMKRIISRYPNATDIVVLVDYRDVPAFCERLCYLRLVATEIDAPINAYRVEENPYEGEVYYREITFAPGDEP